MILPYRHVESDFAQTGNQHFQYFIYCIDKKPKQNQNRHDYLQTKKRRIIKSRFNTKVNNTFQTVYLPIF